MKYNLGAPIASPYLARVFTRLRIDAYEGGAPKIGRLLVRVLKDQLVYRLGTTRLATEVSFQVWRQRY